MARYQIRKQIIKTEPRTGVLSVYQQNGDACYGSPVHEAPHSTNWFQFDTPLQKDVPHLVFVAMVPSVVRVERVARVRGVWL